MRCRLRQTFGAAAFRSSFLYMPNARRQASCFDYYDSMKLHRCVLAGAAFLITASCAQSQAPASAPGAPASATRPAASAPQPAASAASAAQPAASAASAAQPAAPVAQSALTGQLMYELLIGELTYRQGEAQAGANVMLDAARRAGDEALYQRATDMAIHSRSGPAALEAARAWRRAFPDSLQALRYELQVLLALGRASSTETPLRQLLAALPEDEKEPFITALPALYQRAADPAQTARLVETALHDAIQTPALAPAAWTAIGRLRLQAGDNSGALAAVALGQAAGAASEWPARLALQLLTDAAMPDAEAPIQRYLENPQAKPDVRTAYARALVQLNRPADAQAQLDALTRLQPDYPEGWLLKGALLADERRDEEARPVLRRFLQLADAEAHQPGLERENARGQARMMLARMAERRGDLATAEKLLAQVDAPDLALTVQIRRADMLARQGKLKQARQAIRSAPENDPQDARDKLLAEAQLLREHQQPDQSYQMLTDELKRDPDDPALLYDAAMSADRAGRPQDMERLLRRLIEIAPNNANAYNALGYWLADHGQRLQEAKTLIEKAVQLSPDDPFIQDSLGWAQFRLGQLQEARRLLEDAWKKRPDPEIAAHLGEVLWALGESDAARATWREGLRRDPDNETLKQTLERLKIKIAP